MEIAQLLGQNIRRLRQQKSWSQEQLSEATGLHRTYISQIERGVRNPTLTIIQKFSDALGVQVPVLLSTGDEA